MATRLLVAVLSAAVFPVVSNPASATQPDAWAHPVLAQSPAAGGNSAQGTGAVTPAAPSGGDIDNARRQPRDDNADGRNQDAPAAAASDPDASRRQEEERRSGASARPDRIPSARPDTVPSARPDTTPSARP